MSLQNVKQAARWDILIQQGSTFLRVLEFDVDISDAHFRGQIRRSHADPAVLGEFTFEPISEFSVALRMTAEETEALPAERLVHDIEVFTQDDIYVARILEGAVRVTPEVTR